MPKTKKQAEPLSGSPTFVATFTDGEVTRGLSGYLDCFFLCIECLELRRG
jgi:hypothetical protein